jgi:hypothetical protein
MASIRHHVAVTGKKEWDLPGYTEIMRHGPTECHIHTGTQIRAVAWGSGQASIPIAHKGRGAYRCRNPNVRS